MKHLVSAFWELGMAKYVVILVDKGIYGHAKNMSSVLKVYLEIRLCESDGNTDKYYCWLVDFQKRTFSNWETQDFQGLYILQLAFSKIRWVYIVGEMEDMCILRKIAILFNLIFINPTTIYWESTVCREPSKD